MLLLMQLFACKPAVGVSDDKEQNQAEDEEGSNDSSIDDTTSDPCEESEIVVWEVEFPQYNGGCNWGNNGNSNAAQLNHSARYKQVQSFTVEGVICDVSISLSQQAGGIETPYFQYDDHILMTMKNRVLFSTSAEIVSHLQSEDVSLVWNWSEVVDTTMDPSIDMWIAGSDSVVSLPNPGESGDVEILIDDTIIEPLVEESIDDEQFQFSLVTFGDNDNSDCYQTGLSFDVEFSLGQ